MDSARSNRGTPYKPGIPAEPGEKRTAELYEDLADQIDLSEILFTLIRRWKPIAVTVLLTVAATFVVTKFLMTPTYRAEAILRPVSQNAIMQQMAGQLGGFGGVDIGGIATGILGTKSGAEADEYMPILKSFAFTDALVKKHQLREHLLAEEGTSLSSLKEDPDWVVYRILKRRFDCRYATSTDNLTLSYEGHNRSEAERVLGFYIDDLREKLRSRQIRHAAAAIASLQDASKQTADAILQNQLYELIAAQIQRQKIAEVQADFAFIELDPPTSPDRPYRPASLLDCVIAGLLSAIGIIAWIIFTDVNSDNFNLRSSRSVANNMEQSAAPPGTAQKVSR